MIPERGRLGIEQAHETQTLFETPVLTRIAPRATLTATYDLFVTHVPKEWKSVAGLERSKNGLALRNSAGDKVRFL